MKRVEAFAAASAALVVGVGAAGYEIGHRLGEKDARQQVLEAELRPLLTQVGKSAVAKMHENPKIAYVSGETNTKIVYSLTLDAGGTQLKKAHEPNYMLGVAMEKVDGKPDPSSTYDLYIENMTCPTSETTDCESGQYVGFSLSGSSWHIEGVPKPIEDWAAPADYVSTSSRWEDVRRLIRSSRLMAKTALRLTAYQSDNNIYTSDISGDSTLR